MYSIVHYFDGGSFLLHCFFTRYGIQRCCVGSTRVVPLSRPYEKGSNIFLKLIRVGHHEMMNCCRTQFRI